MSRKFNINHNQLSLPFGEMRRGGVASLEDRQKFFWFLVSVLVLSFVAYIYAINATAHNIAIRQNLEGEVANTVSGLSELEFEVVGLKNEITVEKAYTYGFKEVKDPLYVSRDATPSLTLNTPVQ